MTKLRRGINFLICMVAVLLGLVSKDTVRRSRRAAEALEFISVLRGCITTNYRVLGAEARQSLLSQLSSFTGGRDGSNAEVLKQLNIRKLGR